MARVGGRNASFAWVVGIGCAAVLGVLAMLALPLLPASLDWIGAVGKPAADSAAAADGGPTPSAEASGPPAECAGLYDQSLWAELRFTDDAVLTPSTEAPTSSADAFVAALQPAVTLTCSWHSAKGTISTTLATVPSDAGAIAAAALPGVGFTCEERDTRTRCTRTDGEVAETIEAGGGLWLSTSEDGWHPDGYITRTASRVWE